MTGCFVNGIGFLDLRLLVFVFVMLNGGVGGTLVEFHQGLLK